MTTEPTEDDGPEPPVAGSSDLDDMRDPPDDIGWIEMEVVRGDDLLRPFGEGPD